MGTLAEQASLENVRGFVDEELRRGEEKEDVVERLVQMGMDVDSANALVNEFDHLLATQHQSDKFRWSTASFPVMFGLAGALLGGVVWAIFGLHFQNGPSDWIVGAIGLGAGLLPGLAMGLLSRGRNLTYILMGAALALVGLIVGKGLLILRYAIGDMFSVVDAMVWPGALIIAAGLVFLLGGRTQLGHKIRAKHGRTEHPSLPAIVLLILGVGLMTAGVFGTWSHWEVSTTGREENVDFTLWKMHSERTLNGDSTTVTADYSQDLVRPEGRTSLAAMEAHFDRSLALSLFGVFIAAIAFVLFAYPYFGGRVADLYWYFTIGVAILGSLFAAAALIYTAKEFPDAVTETFGANAGGVSTSDSSPAFTFWDRVDAGSNYISWGAGWGWYLLLVGATLTFASAILPWPGRHMRHLDTPSNQPQSEEPQWVEETPATAPAEAAPAEEAWEALPEEEPEPAPPPPPPQPAAASSTSRAMKLKCPDCRTQFELFPQPKPFNIVCPGCSRTTLVS